MPPIDLYRLTKDHLKKYNEETDELKPYTRLGQREMKYESKDKNHREQNSNSSLATIPEAKGQ